MKTLLCEKQYLVVVVAIIHFGELSHMLLLWLTNRQIGLNTNSWFKMIGNYITDEDKVWTTAFKEISR